MKMFLTLVCLIIMVGTPSMAQVPEYGNAVYYADYLHGNKTAMGEIYDMYDFTCAHKTHAQGTLLKVTRVDNGRSVVVRVNDRGPYTQGCIVDISKAAAKEIGLTNDGITQVKVEVVGQAGKTVATSNRPTSYGSTSTRKGVSEKEAPITDNYALPGLGEYVPSKPPSTYSTPTPVEEDIPTSYGYDGYGAFGAAGDAGYKWLPSTQSGYGVQIASYTNQSNAQRRYDSLLERGIDNVYLRPSKAADGSDLFRVVVGVFNDRSAAQREAQKLGSRHSLRGLVIDLSY